ncbi:Thrombospondin type-1 domain-containing protein 4 [Channa argus]|uniref:Thrombospondin type-1 domain-containing protein 4 n=1 Tax=Channa argus TaxID=215402 RepID=A0A6G1PBF2_CHAAH|nr:Thrombospondin type-1 domain-containing protein 4 [Channa argus]
MTYKEQKRPGIFTAVGTQLIYRRPNEIRSRKGESITAPGPLTEDLHAFVTHIHANGRESSVIVAPDLCGSSNQPVTRSPCQLKICSQWEIRSQWSPCSVPCGLGQRIREVVCVSNQGDVEEDEECNMNLKPDTLQNCDMGACARSCCEGERPAEVIFCDAGPCQNQLEWYAGPWGQCSTECGNGTQTRSVACLFNNNGRMEVVDQVKCCGLPQPTTAQTCSLKPCGVQWYVTEWSTCSRSCNGGYRVREVRCLTDNIVPSDYCDPSLSPESREECNTQPCVAEIDPSCSNQYHNCLVVVQARLCVYPYYRSVCCASCSEMQKTYPNHIRR